MSVYHYSNLITVCHSTLPLHHRSLDCTCLGQLLSRHLHTHAAAHRCARCATPQRRKTHTTRNSHNSLARVNYGLWSWLRQTQHGRTEACGQVALSGEHEDDSNLLTSAGEPGPRAPGPPLGPPGPPRTHVKLRRVSALPGHGSFNNKEVLRVLL